MLYNGRATFGLHCWLHGERPASLERGITLLPIDLNALTQHVRAVLTDPHATPATGDGALDAALARLARQRRAGHALPEAATLAYWHGEGLAYWHGEAGPADAHAR